MTLMSLLQFAKCFLFVGKGIKYEARLWVGQCSVQWAKYGMEKTGDFIDREGYRSSGTIGIIGIL